MSDFTVYQIRDTEIELPNDMSDEEIENILRSFMEEETPQESPAMEGEFIPADTMEESSGIHQYSEREGERIHPRTLSQDEDWLHASRAMYKHNYRKDFEGTDEELAEFGLDLMGWFNYNLPAMSVQVGRIQHAPDETKTAMLHMMDTYDNLKITWGGAGRFFRGVLADPTTYLGLGTLGLGLAGREGGRQVTRRGFRELLKQGISRSGTLGAVEGAGYATLDNRMRQEVRIQAGVQDEVNTGQLIASGTLGAGAGLVGGTALDMGISSIAQRNLPTGRTSSEVATATLEAPNNNALPSPENTPTAQNKSFDATQEGYSPALREENKNLFGEVFEFTKLSDLNIVSKNTSIPYERQNMEENIGQAMGLAEELKGLNHFQVEDVIDQMRTAKMTVSEFESFSLSTKLARDMTALEFANVIKNLKTAKSPQRIQKLLNKKANLENTYAKLTSMDEALASHAGYSLRQRQEGLQGLRGKNPEEMGDEEFAQEVFRAMESYQVKRARKRFDQEIEKASARGDMGRVMELQVQRELETNLILDRYLNNKKGYMEKAVEYAVSGVFSTKTLEINLYPSGGKALVRPLLDALVSSPLDKATRVTTGATYSAMVSATRGAWKAAKAAFKYEQAILTRSNMKYFESGVAIEGAKGGFIRTIPRIMNATDEFLSRLAYDGFIAGRAAGEAFEEAKSRGLTGRDMSDFIKGKVKEGVERAKSNLNPESNIDIIAAKGYNRGYRGDELAHYVRTELQKNDSNLSRATDPEGINYVQDVLYKKKFSGKGSLGMSGLAKAYEETTNNHPVLKLLGQLFFRTPVRVIQEGIRLTPAVQFLDPSFLPDLRGVNGSARQVRARGEMLVSLSMMGTFMNLFSQGRITGDGAYDNWRGSQSRRDTDRPEPYSIVLSDGSTWNYRFFDPIATPLKIMANAMERYEKYLMLKQQGELDDLRMDEQMYQQMSVATTALVAAIRDANLFAGIDGVGNLIESIGDDDEAGLVRFMGEKLRLLVPNTIHKAVSTMNPEWSDPVTLEQVITTQLIKPITLGAYEGVVPKSYDALGNLRELKDYKPLWMTFASVSQESRGRGLSEDHLNVLAVLDDINRQTGASFTVPVRHRDYGNRDLRTIPTKDGKSTLYDRWNEIYAELDPVQYLIPIINSPLSVGTKSIQGLKVDQIQNTLSQLRDVAFVQLMAEESGVQEQVINQTRRNVEVKSGQWDSFR